MGSGYMGGMGQSYGMMGSGYPGWSNGMMGGYQGQSLNSTWSQNYSSTQQAVTSSTVATLNNPSTVLAHTADLNLTSKQVSGARKMPALASRAALVLTPAQRKQLAQIVALCRSPDPPEQARSLNGLSE